MIQWNQSSPDNSANNFSTRLRTFDTFWSYHFSPWSYISLLLQNGQSFQPPKTGPILNKIPWCLFYILTYCVNQRWKKYFSFCHPSIIVQYFLLLSRNFKWGLCIYISRNLISYVLFEIYYSKNVKIVLIFYIISLVWDLIFSLLPQTRCLFYSLILLNSLGPNIFTID